MGVAYRFGRRCAVGVALVAAFMRWSGGPIHAAPAAAPARHDAARPRVLTPAVTLDFVGNELVVHAVAAADRRAPTPAIARPAARLRAEATARAALRTALPLVPFRGTYTLGTLPHAGIGPEGFAALADLAVVRVADAMPDGSWRVVLALPLETVRQAVDGTRTVKPLEVGSDLLWLRAPATWSPVVNPVLHWAATTLDCARWFAPSAALPRGVQPMPLTLGRNGELEIRNSGKREIKVPATCVIIFGT